MCRNPREEKLKKAEGFMLGERVVINLVGDAFLVCVDETLVTKVVQMMQMAPSRCSTSNSINSR